MKKMKLRFWLAVLGTTMFLTTHVACSGKSEGSGAGNAGGTATQSTFIPGIWETNITGINSDGDVTNQTVKSCQADPYGTYMPWGTLVNGADSEGTFSEDGTEIVFKKSNNSLDLTATTDDGSVTEYLYTWSGETYSGQMTLTGPDGVDLIEFEGKRISDCNQESKQTIKAVTV